MGIWGENISTYGGGGGIQVSQGRAVYIERKNTQGERRCERRACIQRRKRKGKIGQAEKVL